MKKPQLSCFNPRLPGGRRRVGSASSLRQRCFNPRLPGGRRLDGERPIAALEVFQSTPSGGKATRDRLRNDTQAVAFQSTPSGGKATCWRLRSWGARRVSIHAFRGEGDAAALTPRSIPAVSIHAFRGEGDFAIWFNALITALFQSTPSGGKATRRGQPRLCSGSVSIHAFRGEGDSDARWLQSFRRVSIHAFRGEGDRRR